MFDARLNSNVWDSSQLRSSKQHVADSCAKFINDYEIILSFGKYYPLHITFENVKYKLFVVERDRSVVQTFKVLGQLYSRLESDRERCIIREDTAI